MRTKIEFKATGGELFKELFVGMLLTSITFGIYYPWFLVSLNKMILRRTDLRVGDEQLQLDYTATGGEMFKTLFLGYLFTMWTFGIYFPWFIMKLIRFQQEHIVAVGSQRTYRFNTELTGGQLFKTLIGGYLLTGITFGIYMPWFLVKVARTFFDATEVRADHEAIGTVRFTLTGGEFFKTFLVGYLLTAITFGIYGFWFQVKMLKLFANSTEITVNGRAYRGDFTGTGGEAFKVNFVGYLLTMVTFGIYSFWYMANLLRFQMSNTTFAPVDDLVGGLAEQIEPTIDAPGYSSIPDVRVPRPASRVSSQQLQQQQRPASKAAPAASRPEAVASVDGDRRAPWARAFLPAPGPEPMQTAVDPAEWVPEVWTDRASARAPGKRPVN